MAAPVAFVLLVAFVALVPVACSGQSEGQRCSTLDDNGGSSDCANGLVCDGAGSLGGAAGQYFSEQADPSFGICCPLDRTKAITTICALQPSPPGSDAAPPADAATQNDGAPLGDAADAAATDAPSDAPADAPLDAVGG